MSSTSPASPPTEAIAPLLRKLMADYAATGLPPAYLPKVEAEPHTQDDDDTTTTQNPEVAR